VTNQQGVHVKQCTTCVHSYHNKMLQTITLHSVHYYVSRATSVISSAYAMQDAAYQK